MRIKYIGQGTRIIDKPGENQGAYVWDASNDHVQDIVEPRRYRSA